MKCCNCGYEMVKVVIHSQCEITHREDQQSYGISKADPLYGGYSVHAQYCKQCKIYQLMIGNIQI